MKHQRVRIAIGVLAACIALTAIGGGIAMLGSADQFPTDWLRNTPFSDYTIPTVVLAIVVGGSSLITAVTVFTGRKVGVLASVAAGLILVGYELVEVLTLPALASSSCPILAGGRVRWAGSGDRRTGRISLDG